MSGRAKSATPGTGSAARVPAAREATRRGSQHDRVAAKVKEQQAEIRLLRRQMRALGDRQQRLEREREQYFDLFDFAPVSYALLDGVGIVVRANLATCRLLNVHRAHLIGHPLVARADARDRRELLEHLRRCRSAPGLVESEVRFRSAGDGLVTCRLYSKRAVYGDRDVVPTVVIDQTEHRALDDARVQAEQKKILPEHEARLARGATAARDQFFAAISHELRTPLTPALIAATQLAASDVMPDDTRRLAATIKRNIEVEAHLIDDLLDIARISRDRVDLRLETIDLHHVIGEALAICAPAAHAKSISMQAGLGAPDHHVRGDSLRLHQVFWNLLNNAIKFTDVAGTIVVRSENVSDTLARISVRDNGAGMDSAFMDTLFSPFERKPAQPGGSRSGLGLGLAICRGIVAAHGGRIWAASEGPGRGATFAVELATTPAPDHSTVNPSPRPVASSIASPVPSSQRVLIIEDDADSREMLSLFLSHQGFSVEVAASLSSGLRRLGEAWDVVMSDIGLPDGSGLEVARHARGLSQRPQRLIALTGYGSTSDIDASRRAGFDDHLVKPIDLDQLLIRLGGIGAGGPQ